MLLERTLILVMIRKLCNAKNVADTFRCGQLFAQRLRGGEVVGLKGDLGAGKTIFVKGVAAALGIVAPIQSPTFILRREYKVERAPIKQLIHLDLYRLEKADIKSLEFLEAVGSEEVVTFIEWPERLVFKQLLGKKTLIYFDVSGPDSRWLGMEKI